MGTAILRRYVLLGPIGRGGVSMVYHAVDAVSARPLAIKLLAPALTDDPRARDNVRREAMIIHRLRHPSVPKVYDYGDAPLPDGTVVPYVVMELLTGVALAGRLAGGGSLPWPDAVAAAATVADVLAVAHRRGVVHRDLTPDNIMMTASGLKIIDFGLATTVDPDAKRAARPPVLSPGVRRPTIPRHPVSSASQPADDVYALGVLLYQMLTGRSPYPGASPGMYLAAGRSRTVAPTPVLTVPGLPPGVADICRSCMAKRPADRPASGDVALALWSVLIPGPPAEPRQPPLTAAPLSPAPLAPVPVSPALVSPALVSPAPVSPALVSPAPVSPAPGSARAERAPAGSARPTVLPSGERGLPGDAQSVRGAAVRRGGPAVVDGYQAAARFPFSDRSIPGASVIPRTGVMDA
jgi:serine/threonine-protein kinase